MSKIKPRGITSMDSLIFDEGCAETRRKEIIQHRISELALEQTHREALQARKEFRTYEGFKLPKGKNLEEVYGEEASKFADEIIEQEKHIFAESKEQDVLKLLLKIRNTLKLFMFVADEEGNIVKPTFVHRVVDSADGISHENYADVFGERDRDRINVVNRLMTQVSHVSYLIPYSSDEVKALYAEVRKIATPDHYEVWRNDQVVQVFGGRYEFTDRKLEGKAWRKRVKERAEKLMVEKAKKASE